MNKQQLKPHAHFSRLLAIFHERELLILGVMINLSIIALFGLASNSFHLQTYAQLFEGREFEAPQQPEGCNGQCVYSYNTGTYYRRESTNGGTAFTPCQSATDCRPSNSGSTGGSTGSRPGNSNLTQTGNTAGINNPSCATALGCSQQQSNGSTIFCTSGLCTECTAGGSCRRAGEWPENVVNNDGYCSGPGCAPGTTPPTNVQNCTTSCTGIFPGSGPAILDYGQIMIGGQLIIFPDGMAISIDGKYTRTCLSAGSCTVKPYVPNPVEQTPVTGQNGTAPGADAVGGYGSGTYNDPYSAANLSVLINLCSTATSGCYGIIDGVKYECQKGSCGPARTPPGGVGDPISGNSGGSQSPIKTVEPITKDNISSKKDAAYYTWPGETFTYWGVGLQSVGESQPVFVCGDLICSGNETPASCPQDCGGSSVACTVGASRRLVCE